MKAASASAPPPQSPIRFEDDRGEDQSDVGRDRWVKAVLWRLPFYAVLSILAACGAMPVILLYGMFMIAPGVVFMAAPYVWLYMPLIDWPVAAWRTTGKPLLALVWFGAALIVPVGFPLAVNFAVDQYAAAVFQRASAATQSAAASNTGYPGGAQALHANDLMTREGGCGDVCRALLWSGAADHVVGGVWTMAGVERGVLYTVGQGADCKVGGAAVQWRREDYCVLARQITEPTYDAIIAVRHNWSARPFAPVDHSQTGLDGAWTTTASRCSDRCYEILTRQGLRGEHLTVPLRLHFTMNGIDSSFGMHLNRTPFELGDANPAAVVKAAFGLDVTGFHPRPGFNGDVEHGNPGRLTWREIHEQDAAVDREHDRMALAESQARSRAFCERQRDLALDRIAKWQAYRAAHPGQGWQPNYEEEHPPGPCT